MADISTLNCSAFTPLIGTEVRLTSANGEVQTATVAGASENPKSNTPNCARTAFSVTFTTPTPGSLDSGDYTIAHPTLGDIGPVNISPIMSNTAEGAFQLIFN